MFKAEQIPAIPSSEEIAKKVEFRQNQSFASRLAEHITGLRPDDPRMAERLVEDQKVIRAKYNLPDYSSFPNLAEYERFLRNRADELGVKIRETSDCGKFFEENGAAGVYFETDKTIGANIDRENRTSYNISLQGLEHELVHSLQHKYQPGMPIESMEYEAYVSGSNFESLLKQTHPETLELFFSFYVGGSVNMNYNERSAKSGKEISPEWDNPRFFLEKVDGFTPAEIDTYFKPEPLEDAA